MDFVTAWKASSIVLTGAFGVLGLVKDYKNKRTKKFTVWGKVSLGGILLSSGLGVIAQLKESSDQERAKAATAAQTLKRAQNTDQAVRDIQRVLYPLDDPRFFMQFHISCSDPHYEDYCNTYKYALEHPQDVGIPIGGKEWSHWPGGNRASLYIQTDFFIDPKSAEHFINMKERPSTVPGSRGNIVLYIAASNYEKDNSLVINLGGDHEELLLGIRGYIPEVEKIQSDGKIRSALDLRGVTVVVSDVGDDLALLVLKDFQIRFKNGQSLIYKGPFERITVRNKVAYRFQLPND